MEIFVNVTNQKMSISSSFCNVVSGSQEFVKFKFILGEEWDGLLTFAQFTQNGNAYNSYLDENNCAYLPSEINGGTCTLMLYGADGTVKATTNYLTLKVESSALISDASSTNISKSLYDQLVERFNRIANLDQSQYGAEIARQVSEIMAGYLANGDIAAATIQDGSIARTKVNSAFEATLAKADNSWQKSANAPSGTWEATYDTGARKTDIFNYTDAQIGNITNRSNTGALDITNAEITNARVFQHDYEPQYNAPISGQVNYNTLKDAMHGFYQQSKSYTDGKFRDYSPFDIQFLESAPVTGETTGLTRTFYLVPKTDSEGNITGYDKWWYIQNADGYWVWDTFGSTSTVVTTAADLPNVGNPDTDYIVAVDGGYVYKKYINNEWVVIAGSMAKVLTVAQFEALQSGDELTDYYVPNSDGVYLHYRWINNGFELIGSDSYSKSDVDTIVQNLSSTIGNRIGSVESDVQTNETNIESLSRTINRVASDLDNLDVEGYTYDTTITQDDNGNYIFRLIETKDGESTTKYESVLPSGGGGSTATTTIMTVERVTASPLVITTDGSAIIQLDFSSVDSDNQTMDSTYTWKLGNNVIMTGELNQGRNTFDLSDYCIVGTQKFTFIATDGFSTNVKTWTIQKVDVRIESGFSDRTTNEIGKSVSFTYTPYGSVSKIIHFKLDGIENTITTSASGTIQSYTIPAQTHGSHLLEVWATATINDVPIETSHIYKDIIWYDPEKDSNNEYLNPVIGCIYRFDYYGNVTAKQYDTVGIAYNVFDPSTTYPIVKRYADNVLVGTETMTSSQGLWNFKSSDIGLHILRLECRNTSVTIKVNVTELGIDVSPITGGLEVDFNPTGVTNNSDNRLWSNQNYHMTVSNNFDWANGGYKVDENGDTYFLIKSGTRATFDYKMFAGNANGNPSTTGAEMKIVFMTKNVQDVNAVWFTNTETIVTEIDGETTTTNTGIQMRVHDGWLKTSNASDTEVTEGEGDDADTVAATNTYLYMPYSEEDIIEMDINIDTVDRESPGAQSFVMAYEDGVPSKAYVYKNSERFYQYTPQDIVIGSDYCDVRIYRFKIYSTALSTSNIMRNFIADSRNSDIMLARYNRNAIYYNNETHAYTPYSDTNNVVLDPEKLAPLIPNVKVLLLDTDHFTTSKKTFVKSSLRCIHAPGGTLYSGDAYYDNWLFENGWHSGQGTTSDNYGNAGRNVDFLFNCDGTHKPSDKVESENDYISRVTLGYNTENATTESVTDWKGNAGKVSLTRTSIPNNFFNLKVNIASSENVNNALLQKRYNDYLPYFSPAKRRDTRIKNDMEFVPAILFVRESNPDISTHNEFLDTNYHFYALGNIGDSKKTDYTRAYDPTDMNEFTIEISDNTKNNAVFQSGVYMVYQYSQVASPSVSDIKNYFEYVNGQYVQTTDKSIDANKTYYTRSGTRTIEDFTVRTEVNEKGKTVQTPVSTSKPSSFVYPITLAEWNNENNMRRWCLYNEAFDGDHSFEPRYACCGDYRDGKLVNDTTGNGAAQIAKNNEVWRAFYRWVVTSTDQEFRDEIEEWVVKDAVEYFYAFTHMYTMMDNRAKNTFWHFSKTGTYREVSKPVPELLHVYCELINDEYVATEDTEINANKTYYTQYAFDMWMYDGDTGLGINNNGELVFPYGKEDIDYNIDNNPNSGYVFNGATSVFWCRLRDLFPGEIDTMFNTKVSSDCFSASSLINQFDSFQECFPEEIWRLDIQRKYIRTFLGTSIDNSKPKLDTQYLRDMMQGRKKYQRRQWVRDQETYFGTKHMMSTVVGDQNRITFRCYKPGDSAVVPANYAISITPFSDMYITAMFGNGDTRRIRAKAGDTKDLTFEASDATDTQVTIYCANRISALNDLSACYIAANNFSMATKLRKLVLGNTTEGYSNPRLTSLTLGDNKLLEELDIRNCNNLAGTIDFTQCSNLLKLYAEGTKLTGAIFANNGKIQIAHLPNTINTLFARNLNNLTDFSATLNRLETLTMEGGTLDSKSIVLGAASTLRNLYLYNINWIVPDTTLMNTILGMFDTLLTGSVNIAGAILRSEYNNYTSKWNDLSVTYSSMTTEYVATFVNYDETVLFTQYVASGHTPVDPITNGDINAPTRPVDEQYSYTFSGWSNMTQMNSADRTIYAVYDSTEREYTVQWYSDIGGSVIYTLSNLKYGDEAVFSGTLPTKTGNEQNNHYYVFTGWDKSTGYIKGNMDVYPVWEHADGLPTPGTDLSTMTCAEIYGISQAVFAGRVADISDYYEDKDYFDLPLGQDFDFSNVTSDTLIENSNATGIDKYTEGRFFDGTDYLDTNIRLFDEDSDSFTLAIDYEFIDSTAANNGDDQTLVSCAIASNSGEGFRIHRVGTGSALLKWSTQNAINHKLGRGTNRNMLVLRHTKGSKFLHIYTSDKQASLADNADDSTNVYDMTITVAHEEHKTEPWTNSNGRDGQVLTFGALRSADGLEHSGFATGWIHWCKIWHDDLGDDVAKKLASWTHEKVRMEYYGTRRYDISGSSPRKRASASFLANNPLALFGKMNSTNTNAGGWAASQMRTFLNTRVYDALAYKWQNIIKTVEVMSSPGNSDSSGEVVTSNDKLYLPANMELGGYTSSPYKDEVLNQTPISFLTSDYLRIKFPGVILDYPKSTAHPNGMVFIDESSDPTNSELTSYAAYTGDSGSSTIEIAKSTRPIKEGDVWLRPENSGGNTVKTGHIYMSPETIAKHSRIGYKTITSNNVQASDGGCWVRAYNWSERSPNASGYAYFMVVTNSGNQNFGNYASNGNGVVLSFSI